MRIGPHGWRAGKPSCGLSKVYKKEDIPSALEEAYREDNEVLIEGFLDGREVTVGVMRINGKVTVLPITEIVSMNDFFDYRAKYEGLSKEKDEFEIKRSKGLGENQPDMMSLTTMHPATRRLVRVTPENSEKEADDISKVTEKFLSKIKNEIGGKGK